MAVQQFIQTIMRRKLPTQSLTSIAVPIVSRMYGTDAATWTDPFCIVLATVVYNPSGRVDQKVLLIPLSRLIDLLDIDIT